MKFKFQCPLIKLHRNTARLLCLRVSAGKTIRPTEPKIFTIWLLMKKVC